jgi:hypothetical protein
MNGEPALTAEAVLPANETKPAAAKVPVVSFNHWPFPPNVDGTRSLWTSLGLSCHPEQENGA